MKKTILAFVYLSLAVYAEDIRQLYTKVDNSEVLLQYTKTIEANLEEERGGLYDDQWSIDVTAAYADLKDGSDSSAEYAVGISKDFILQGSTLEKIIRYTRQKNEIAKTIQKNKLRVFLLKLYGNYCIMMDALQAKGELAVVYESIRDQIDKGVEFGEFDSSKSVMAHLTYENLNLEISKIENELENYEAQIKAIVPFDGQFVCERGRVDFIKLFEKERPLMEELLHKQLQKNKESLSLAQTTFEKVNAQAAYVDELDTKRYVLNLSVPLRFGSNKTQALKAKALASLLATNYEIKAYQRRYENESKALQRQLKIYKKYVKDIERSIKEASTRLIAQSKERFNAGEDSLIELLKATETKIQMIDAILQLKLQRHNAVTSYMAKYAIDPQGVMK